MCIWLCEGSPASVRISADTGKGCANEARYAEINRGKEVWCLVAVAVDCVERVITTMGRYSSVQAYADNNANARVVPYEQATGSAAPKPGVVVAEKVTNPYGSTAGAGSGEFHVYRHARAREMERWKYLEEEEREQLLRQDYEKQLEANKNEEEQRTEKRRKKRQRQKDAKMRKKNLKLVGISSGTDDLKDNSVEEEEFTYEPDHASANDEEKKDEKESEETMESKEARKLPFANDGSFLEQTKQQLADGSKQNKNDDDEESRPKKKQAL